MSIHGPYAPYHIWNVGIWRTAQSQFMEFWYYMDRTVHTTSGMLIVYGSYNPYDMQKLRIIWTMRSQVITEWGDKPSCGTIRPTRALSPHLISRYVPWVQSLALLDEQLYVPGCALEALENWSTVSRVRKRVGTRVHKKGYWRKLLQSNWFMFKEILLILKKNLEFDGTLHINTDSPPKAQMVHMVLINNSHKRSLQIKFWTRTHCFCKVVVSKSSAICSLAEGSPCEVPPQQKTKNML